MADFLQSIHADLIGLAFLGFLTIVGFLHKAGFISRPTRRTDVAAPESFHVSKAEFEEAIQSIRSQLDEVSAMAAEAKTSATAAALSLQTIAASIDTSMRLLAEKFENATGRLERTAERMLDRLDDQDIRLATATARISGQSESLTQFRENIDNRLVSLEESLRRKA